MIYCLAIFVWSIAAFFLNIYVWKISWLTPILLGLAIFLEFAMMFILNKYNDKFEELQQRVREAELRIKQLEKEKQIIGGKQNDYKNY